MGIYEPKELSPKHKEALRLLALCSSLKDIAGVVGLSVWTISKIRRSQKGQEYLGRLNREMDELTIRTAANLEVFKLTSMNG